jgi:hypothetical protein
VASTGLPIYQITQLPNISILVGPLRLHPFPNSCKSDLQPSVAALANFMKQLKKSKASRVPTVNRKPAAVVQDAEAYQHLLDISAQADAEEGIRQGLDNAKEGKLRPAREFFDEFDPAMAYLVSITSGLP